MKIKVGDWVLIEGKVGRVTKGSIPEDFNTWIEVDGVMQVANDCTKLPIKFKGFDVVLNDYGLSDGQLLWHDVRAPKGIGYISFTCTKTKGNSFFHVGINPVNGKYINNDLLSIEQAKDWIELQYATMLAKARGLI